MSFASPALLSLLALAPLAGLAYLYLARWRQRAMARFAPSHAPADLSPSLSPTRRALKAALVVVAVALLALAAARPRIGHEEVLVQQEGVDLVVALDVSDSMLADDAAPSRLQRAQREIAALLERLPGDRVGLVLFAGSALVRSPLTSDMRALQSLVDRAGTEAPPLLPGTDLGQAIEAARRALASGQAESQAILVVSDGEDHGIAAFEEARAAAREGIIVHTAVLGTPEGAMIPLVLPDGQVVPKTDLMTGDAIVSHADEGLLRQLADLAGGTFLSLSGEDLYLTRLADEFRGLRQTLFAVESEERPIERFQPFLLAALAALAAETIISERRRPSAQRRLWPRWALLPILLLSAGLAAGCASAAFDFNEDGNDLYDRGEYAEALESYRRAQALEPDSSELNYNAGNTLHRLELYDQAVQETLRALPVDDPSLAARVHYNLGNHYFRLGLLSEALDEYKQTLLLDPTDEDAKYNLELVQQQIALQPQVGEQPAAGNGTRDGARPRPGGEGLPGIPGGEEPSGQEPSDRQEVQQELSEALAGIDEEFTIAEALRVLDLIQERSRLQAAETAPSEGEPGGPPDY